MIRPLYLDPGSASILLQMIGGGVVAVVVSLKLFWRRILALLHIRTDDPEPGAAPGPESEADPGPGSR
ncbi:MAG: hypothetical protein JWO11_2892 [Nocardioides sp.]|nr:hypothetical protein [Nocardioides sp.]